jgi:hypothetical protein
MEHSRANIEWFEDYLTGEISAEDRDVFERRLSDDAAFRQAFDEHKRLREGLEMASLSHSLEQVRRIHSTLSDEDLKPQSAERSKTVHIRNWQTMAATLLIGILMTTAYFKLRDFESGSFNGTGSDGPALYGSGNEQIPILEKNVTVTVVHFDSSFKSTQMEQVMFQVFQSRSQELLRMDTTNHSIALWTPYDKTVSDIQNERFNWTYYSNPDHGIPVFQMVSEDAAFSLPVPPARWLQMIIE